MARTAFLGLGVMGFHMAGHLAAKGHEVVVWNRTRAKAEDWGTQHKGEVAKDPAAAAFGAEHVLMCLGDDPDVAEVFTAMEPSIAADMVVVHHTTASADLARDLYARCKAKGAHFLDAPLSGGEAGARNGALTIMCGGDDETFAQAEPVMAAYGGEAEGFRNFALFNTLRSDSLEDSASGFWCDFHGSPCGSGV